MLFYAYTVHMGKVRTTIRMNEDVVKMAKKLGVNISAFTEMKLLEHFKDLENLRRESINIDNKNDIADRQSSGGNPGAVESVGPLRFELKLLAPQARRMPSYPTGPKLEVEICFCFKNLTEYKI